jgi:hypothetical protein
MYKTYWDVDGNFISSDTPSSGSPTTFTVPDNANIAYMWATIQQKDIDDGSYKLIHHPSETVKCTGITLDRSTLTFTAEGAQTLTATVTPDGCTDVVVWTTDSESVATVYKGTVYAVGDGVAEITATCGDYSASCSVAVSGVGQSVAQSLTHSFTGSSATSTEWVDSVDPSYSFAFTGSPTVGNGVVAFSSNSYGVLNKALDTEDADTTLAIKVKMDNAMTYTWAFGSPNWNDGFIIGKYETFGVDSSNITFPMGKRASGEKLFSNSSVQNLKLTDPDSNYHVYTAKYIKSESVTYWYCDGVLMGSFGESVITNWLSGIINLNNEGAQYRGNNSFEYIKIWNRALSDEEIAVLI